MKKYPFVHQRENKDCGVACLSMIIKYYRGYIGEDTLYDMTLTNKRGTSAYNLIEAAKTIGMKAEGMKCKIEHLKSINFPCIAHVLLEQKFGHYVVIYDINWKKKELYIGDPAKRRMKISIQNFEKIFTNVIIIMTPEKPLPKYENKDSFLNYLKILLCTYKKDWLKIWIESIICVLFSIIVSCSLIVMLQGIQIHSKTWISYTILLFIFLGIIKNIITGLQEKMISKMQHKLNIQLMIKAIKNIIFLPYQFYCNRSTGEIVSRLQDLENVGYELSQIVVLLCVDSTMSFVSGFMLYKINSMLCKIVILWLIIYIIIAYVFRKQMEDKVALVKQNASMMYNNFIESIKGFETIKGLQLEKETVQSLSKEYIKYNQESYELECIERKQNRWKNIVSEIGYICICGLGCIQVVKGNMTISEVLLYQTLVTYFLLPIEHILELNTSISDMKKSIERAIEIMYHKNEERQITCKHIKSLECKNLSYEQENKVLKNISFKIHSHEKILLMGNSGSGKSTLLKIMKGYYPISNGKVYINDLDINSYTKESIGEKITYISQNEILFTDTIYNNITLHRNFSEEEIINQISMNYIDEITKQKRIGLGEIIEEDGYNLSGGERQRIILARALLKESDVIFIDEGFSQMDHNLERNILKKLFQKYKEKIIVVVSHRKDNIDLFDTYIELQHGKIHTYLSKSKN